MSTDAPELTYWHAWTGNDGMSHQERRAITGFERQSMGGAAPQWNALLREKPARAMFSVLPPSWTGDWHENPAPQTLYAIWVNRRGAQRP